MADEGKSRLEMVWWDNQHVMADCHSGAIVLAGRRNRLNSRMKQKCN
jgi:hypothetical protein